MVHFLCSQVVAGNWEALVLPVVLNLEMVSYAEKRAQVSAF